MFASVIGMRTIFCASCVKNYGIKDGYYLSVRHGYPTALLLAPFIRTVPLNDKRCIKKRETPHTDFCVRAYGSPVTHMIVLEWGERKCIGLWIAELMLHMKKLIS